MVTDIKLIFKKNSTLSGFTSQNTFFFQGNSIPTEYGKGKRGNVNVSRTINKNLIQSTLPVSEYDEGGLCVDIGFCDDTFSIDFETHSWYEYRLLASLVKCNTGMVSGTFYFGGDTFEVAVRNCSFSFPSGRGGVGTDANDVYVKVNISLTIVNSRFAT